MPCIRGVSLTTTLANAHARLESSCADNTSALAASYAQASVASRRNVFASSSAYAPSFCLSPISVALAKRLMATTRVPGASPDRRRTAMPCGDAESSCLWRAASPMARARKEWLRVSMASPCGQGAHRFL